MMSGGGEVCLSQYCDECGGEREVCLSQYCDEGGAGGVPVTVL